jgi:hypothetical protein
VTTVVILVEKDEDGRPVLEEVRVAPKGGNLYELLQSPGLALGLAAGDVFALAADKSYEVISRGGNVCIQIFAPSVDVMKDATTRAIEELGGRLDGYEGRELIYTVSAAVGFPAIEAALQRIKDEFPVAEWFYGNVYEPTDGVTPLNWWKKD